MKTIIKTLAILFLTAFVLTCASTSSANFAGLGRGTDAVPLTSRALTGTLPNGLRYYILENTLPENRAYLSLVVNAGSVLERDDQRGFAHFVEHLAFNDTARFPHHELIEYLRTLGSRFGADANAYTSYNETVYHFDVPVEVTNGIKKIPDRSLAILDDWTHAVSFLPEDVTSESHVVLEELRARLGAMDRARKIMLPILFEGSAYANREPIGLANIIENATSDGLRGFYDRWYRSDNMALVFVGDFDGRALEADLSRHFNMPKAAQSVERPLYELPPPVNGRFRAEIITDPEQTSQNIMIYYKQRQSAERGTIAYYRQSVIDYLIDTMLTLRFDEASSDPSSSSNESWGGRWRWSVNSSYYNLGTEPKTGNTEQALRQLLLEKESIRRFGFTQGELDRAKLDFVSYMERQVSESDRRESRMFMRGFTDHFLYGEDMADIEWEARAVSSLLPGIGLNEIKHSVQNYFSANDITVFIHAPQSEAGSLPSADRIREIFRETENTQLRARENVSISSDFMDRVPAAGQVVSEQLDNNTGAHIMTLANGARIIFKETANRNNEIVLYAMANGGSTSAQEESAASVELLSQMINYSGLGPYSRNELINMLAGRQVSSSFWLSDYYRGFQGTSTTQDIRVLFEMLHIFFTNPRLDERAVEAMLDQYRTYLAHQNEDPQVVFSNELKRIINNNHPLFNPLELNDLDSVSSERASAFLQRCLNPGDYTFVFTGNLNLNTMRELSAVYIGSIPASTPFNSWFNPGISPPSPGRRTINKGVDQRSIVYLGWFARSSSGFDEQKNQTAAVLSEYLDIVLTNEIRERLGGVYSVSSNVSVTVIPSGEYKMYVYFICDPARVQELVNAVRAIINSLISVNLDQNIFNMSKEALLMQHDRQIQQNLHIAQSYANSSVLYSTPLNRLNLRPDVIRSVTIEDVRALCRQMIVSNPVEVVLMPE